MQTDGDTIDNVTFPPLGGFCCCQVVVDYDLTQQGLVDQCLMEVPAWLHYDWPGGEGLPSWYIFPSFSRKGGNIYISSQITAVRSGFFFAFYCYMGPH